MGTLTWLVRDAQNLLHRRTLHADQAVWALIALLEPSPDAQGARLIDHKLVRDHAPSPDGLVFIDLPNRRVLNASRDRSLTRVPFGPGMDHLTGTLTVIDAFNAAGKVLALRFNARRTPAAETTDVSVDPFATDAIDQPPLNVQLDPPPVWDELDHAVHRSFPGGQVRTDRAYSTGWPTAQVTLDVAPRRLARMIPLMAQVHRLNPDDWDGLPGTLDLPLNAWDLFNLDVILDLAPFTEERLAPDVDEGDEHWFERIQDRLRALDVEFMAPDIAGWDAAIVHAVDL